MFPVEREEPLPFKPMPNRRFPILSEFVAVLEVALML
jgi:hypothetical protein